MPHQCDEILKKVSFTISKLLNRDLSTVEDFQIINYTKYQKYKIILMTFQWRDKSSQYQIKIWLSIYL